MTKDRKVAWVAMEKLVPLVLKVFPKHPWLTFPPRPPRPHYCESDGLVVVFILCSLHMTRSVPVSGAIRVDCVTGGGGGIVGGGECPPQGSHAAWVENQEPHLTNRRTTFWKHCLPPPSSGDSAFFETGGVSRRAAVEGSGTSAHATSSALHNPPQHHPAPPPSSLLSQRRFSEPWLILSPC